MINWIEKGHGLVEKIEAAGVSIWHDDGIPKTSNDALAQLIIDEYSIAECAAYRCQQVDARAKIYRDLITSKFSPGEMASWSIKAAEAAKYASTGNASDAPILAAEAAAREVSLASIVDRVQSNSAALVASEAAIAGAAGKHKDAIRALNTFAEILNYNINVNWP